VQNRAANDIEGSNPILAIVKLLNDFIHSSILFVYDFGVLLSVGQLHGSVRWQ